MSDKKVISGRFGRWVLVALGTLIIGLAGVWLKHYLGPDARKVPPARDPCVAYAPPDADYIKEVLEQAQMDTGGPKSVSELLHESILVGHFLLWVVDCGKAQEVYEHGFENFRIRVTPYSVYTDTEGRECRELAVSQKIGGRWQGSSDIYCRIGGKWTPVDKGN